MVSMTLSQMTLSMPWSSSSGRPSEELQDGDDDDDAARAVVAVDGAVNSDAASVAVGPDVMSHKSPTRLVIDLKQLRSQAP